MMQFSFTNMYSFSSQLWAFGQVGKTEPEPFLWLLRLMRCKCNSSGPVRHLRCRWHRSSLVRNSLDVGSVIDSYLYCFISHFSTWTYFTFSPELGNRKPSDSRDFTTCPSLDSCMLGVKWRCDWREANTLRL